MNALTRTDFELAYYDVAVELVSHNTMRTPERKKERKKEKDLSVLIFAGFANHLNGIMFRK